MHKRVMALGVVSVLASTYGPGLCAQEAEELVLEEIVVTATKREMAIQDTSIAISAFQDEDLDFKALHNVQDLQFQVPSLIYGETLGNPQISIRGVGLPLATGDAEQGVASHIDGVYLSRPTLSNLALGDLERVEVLRGPQGTLYGRSSTGGTINYITKKPTENPAFGGRVGIGSFDTYKIQGYVSGPIIDNTLLGRLFIKGKVDDGYIDNTGPGGDLGERDEYSARIALRVIPSENFTADIQMLYYDDEGNYAGAEARQTVVNFGPGFTPQEGQFDPRPFSEIHDFKDTADRSAIGGIVTLGWSFDDANIRSISAYYKHKRRHAHDFDFAAGTVFDGLAVGRDDDVETYTQEINASGSWSDSIEWIAGGFYLHENSLTQSFEIPSRTLFSFVRDLSVESYALFTDVTFFLNDQIRLIGGIRASREKQEGDIFAVAQGNPIPGCAGDGFYDQSFSNVSSKGVIEWDAAESVLVYVQYQQGHKPGGLNTNSCLDVFDEERIDSFEIGFKGLFLDGRLKLNSAVFHYAYDDLQVFRIENFASLVENVPETSITGAEFEFQARINNMVSLDGGATWLDAEYDEFSAADQFAFGPMAPVEDLSGNDLTRTPEWSVVAGINIDIPIAADGFGDVRLRVEVAHSSSYFLRRFNRDFSYDDGYTLGNLYASVEVTQNVELRAFVKNITDTEYLINVFDNTSNGQTDANFGRLREWGMEASIDF